MLDWTDGTKDFGVIGPTRGWVDWKEEADHTLLPPWAKEHLKNAVPVKESILKAVVKDYVNQTGEVLPGVRIDARPDKFTVKVDR